MCNDVIIFLWGGEGGLRLRGWARVVQPITLSLPRTFSGRQQNTKVTLPTLKVTVVVRNKSNIFYTNIYFGTKYKTNREYLENCIACYCENDQISHDSSTCLPGQIAFHNVDSCKSLNYQHF